MVTERKGSTMSDTATITEARGYGLDVEAERCDTESLRDDNRLLRHMDADFRGKLIPLMNEGWSLTIAAEMVEAGAVV